MTYGRQGGERREAGFTFDIVLKRDQRTGKLTCSVFKEVLTKSSFHPHGIKVRLETGEAGGVKEVIDHRGAAGTQGRTALGQEKKVTP